MILRPQVTGSILTKRGINQITRVCNRVVALEQRTRLAGHFERSAYRKYGYKPRKPGYEIKKANQTGQTAPLVFHGDLKQAVLGSARVSATATRGTVSGRGSRTSNLRGQYREEVETVSATEQRASTDNWGDTYTELAQQTQFHKKIRTKT